MKYPLFSRFSHWVVWAVLLLGFWLMQGGGYVPGFGRVLP